jgi:hypothetical protein
MYDRVARRGCGPASCSRLAARCWAASPTARPTATRLVQELERMLGAVGGLR